ncbi:protein kinase [Micromonospora sp. KC207]|uniref:methylation-associated defense system protein kinase MAD6 n=1 Tax=Micromonospora sp. KC207 TaxID=2530377 RepID=UPI00104B913B|nr:serine/threonine protein kinase [Micromonospora sp. KC207]TDC57337.1 protein kinase [Micromonospora sp. KC207]
MAEIVGGSTPANDGERRVIAHLRDNAPGDWFVLHNIEIPVRGSAYEVDLVVVTTRAVHLIDVKGTAGRIDVAGVRWYPQGRDSFASPVRKLRGHARALKGMLERARPELSQVYVGHLVVLVGRDARLVDPSDRPDADAIDVVDLPGLIPALDDPARIRAGMIRDIRSDQPTVLNALGSGVRRRTGPRHFGNWQVCERLGGDEEVTEYRARNATFAASETVLLRVYRADPFLPADQRAAQRHAIGNAYEVLTKMPSSPHIVGRRDFFPTDDEGQFVLVLDDVNGQPLTVHLTDPRQALSADVRLRVVADMLRGLAHAHTHRVLHRALAPASVLVTRENRGVLTGFDYARPQGPRDHSVIDRLADVLDPAYVAPECQRRAQAMSPASDVYAAGVIAYRLLTGELPFATTDDQTRRGSVLPPQVMTAAGLSPALAALLRRMCALAPSARPTATEALRDLAWLIRPGNTRRAEATSAPTPPQPDFRDLPPGYQLTHKFTIRRRLGKPGSYGTAYQAYDRLAGLDRAVKIVHRDRDSVVERLRVEYQLLLRLPAHPSVVKVESADFLDGGDIPYLVFEYVDGQQVADLVSQRALGPADTVRLGVDVADGLVYLHENGIYHCDIKPANLLRTDNGCKIIDFNVAVSDDSSLSRTGGTARYAPPDFATGGPVTRADLIDRDVYALGLTLYEVLTGQWPFSDRAATMGRRPDDPRQVPGLGNLSARLVHTLSTAIAPLRSERYTSAQQLRDALRDLGDQVFEPVRSEPADPVLPPPTPSSAGSNPFVGHLQTLYSQSVRSNAGTRAGGNPAFDLYVTTALDDRLTPDVLAGTYRLVVITGNAGDGKTAFLERLLTVATKDGPRTPVRRSNGADFETPTGLVLRTNHDGSQDESDKHNDDVLLDFFAPFAGAGLAGVAGETRLIAINEGRLVDFLDTHRSEFPALADQVLAGLHDRSGAPAAVTGPGAADPGTAGPGGSGSGVVVINLNRRSLLDDSDELNGAVFDRMLGRMTHPRRWEGCDGCVLVDKCYARHNARTFAHPAIGPKITARLRMLYRLTELRGIAHITVRDVQSALAFMLTSGRDCADIHELYASDQLTEVLDGFYFNSWAGPAGGADRLLNLLTQVDVAAVADPGLDRRLDYVGPDAGRALMTVDRRGEYDLQMLQRLVDELPRGTALSSATGQAHRRYLAAARRRFYFECVDDERSRRMLPYRSASDFLNLLARPDELPSRLPELIGALNRGEGLGDAARIADALALQVRAVPDGRIRSYRLFPAGQLSLRADGAPQSPYLEGGAQELVLGYRGAADRHAALRIRLDLFELLTRLRDGYLPGIAERQGLHLGLTIFKHELSAAPYQELLLTVTGRELWRVLREPAGQVRMEPVAPREES